MRRNNHQSIEQNERQLLFHGLLIGNKEVDKALNHLDSLPSDRFEEQKSFSEQVLNLRVQNNVFASKAKQSDSQKSDTDNDFNSDSLEIENNQSQSYDMSVDDECKKLNSKRES